jgi:hypothetical protein
VAAWDEYNSWDDGFKDAWDDIPGIPYAEDWEIEQLEDLFEIGFMHSSAEPDYNADVVHQAREEFFEFLGLEYSDFPWDEWREAMGYE